MEERKMGVDGMGPASQSNMRFPNTVIIYTWHQEMAWGRLKVVLLGETHSTGISMGRSTVPLGAELHQSSASLCTSLSLTLQGTAQTLAKAPTPSEDLSNVLTRVIRREEGQPPRQRSQRFSSDGWRHRVEVRSLKLWSPVVQCLLLGQSLDIPFCPLHPLPSLTFTKRFLF
jgi:hypothetical protein